MAIMKLLSMIVVATILFTSPATAGFISVPAVAGGDLTVEVASFKEARFKATVRQQYDFSCGSAALATLLSFHYEDQLGEPELFKAMYDAGDQQKIQREGFSMLDMKNYLHARGYAADGFRVSLDKLGSVGVPAIVLINHEGYRHFVVLKGINEREVLLGDPSYGLRTMPRDQFESIWNGLFFLIRNKLDVAKLYFNQPEAWQVHAKAPLGMALSNRDLANVTWLLPGEYEF